MKKSIIFLLLSMVTLQPAVAQKISPDSVLAVMNKVAKWQLREWKEHGPKAHYYDWTMGACYAGYMGLSQVATYSTYLDDIKAIGEKLQWKTGPRHTMADDYCVAQMYDQMYLVYSQPVMIAQWKEQADSVIALPHTESLEWKNNIANREWAWCDALFMGPPAFAYLSTATGDTKYLDAACKLWWKTTDYLFDKDENLYYRDSRFFNQKEANGKKVFWSRGNGWVMGGLVRMLDNMPENYPGRKRFEGLYKEIAAKIASLQNTDGTWHAALLDPASYPVKETSGTGFYCYALAYGINHHLISRNKYWPVVARAWATLTGCVQSDGKLGYVQQIGEKPEKVTADDTETYGVGAFLLAGSEIYKMVHKQ
ncbi:MAG TPA: glycoside hydrolase family 88 protein [Mucilaginibacter sp.]|nr:glycoside hydrolase family 88 protein [Mucilaginibacter sp.]